MRTPFEKINLFKQTLDLINSNLIENFKQLHLFERVKCLSISAHDLTAFTVHLIVETSKNI